MSGLGYEILGWEKILAAASTELNETCRECAAGTCGLGLGKTKGLGSGRSEGSTPCAPGDRVGHRTACQLRLSQFCWHLRS